MFELTGRLLSAGDQRLASLGMSSARWQVLGAIAMTGAPQPVANIARNMGLTRQAVQRLVNELASEGVLNFAPNPHHQRARLVLFSLAGSRAFQAAADRQAPWAERLASRMAAADLQAAVRIVRELAARLACMTDDVDRLIEAWAADAAVLQRLPGDTSTQMHRGIGGSCLFRN